MNGPKKIVLAYSGGLDTSVILAWLKETYGAEIVAYTADLGQAEELIPVREKAFDRRQLGPHRGSPRRVRPRLRVPCAAGEATYEAGYLLGTSFARPLIAKAQVAVARAEGADAVAHGATGKGTTRSASSSPTPLSAPTSRSSLPGGTGTSARAPTMAYAERQGIRSRRRPPGPTPWTGTSSTSPTRAGSRKTRGPSLRRRCSC